MTLSSALVTHGLSVTRLRAEGRARSAATRRCSSTPAPTSSSPRVTAGPFDTDPPVGLYDLWATEVQPALAEMDEDRHRHGLVGEIARSARLDVHKLLTEGAGLCLGPKPACLDGRRVRRHQRGRRGRLHCRGHRLTALPTPSTRPAVVITTTSTRLIAGSPDRRARPLLCPAVRALEGERSCGSGTSCWSLPLPSAKPFWVCRSIKRVPNRRLSN